PRCRDSICTHEAVKAMKARLAWNSPEAKPEDDQAKSSTWLREGGPVGATVQSSSPARNMPIENPNTPSTPPTTTIGPARSLPISAAPPTAASRSECFGVGAGDDASAQATSAKAKSSLLPTMLGFPASLQAEQS